MGGSLCGDEGLIGESGSTNLSPAAKLAGKGGVSDLIPPGLISWSKLSKVNELEDERVESRDEFLSSTS